MKSIIRMALPFLAIVLAIGLAQQPRVLTIFFFPGPESEAMQHVVDFWNQNRATTAGFTTELVVFSRGNYFDRLDAALQSGSSEFDLAMTATYNLGRESPFLVDLTDAFADAEGQELLSHVLSLSAAQHEGRLFAIPHDISLHLLYYRTDLFDQLLSDPAAQATYREIAQRIVGQPLDPKHPSEWVWDDYKAAAAYFTLSINPQSPTLYGTVLPLRNIIFNTMIWNGILYSMGGVWPDDQGQPGFVTEPAREAAQLWTDMYAVGMTAPASTTFEFPESNEAFKTNGAAFMLQWNAAFNELNDPERSPLVAGKVGLTHFPGPTPSTHVHSLELALSTASDMQAEGIQFLRFVASQEAMLLYAQSGGLPPYDFVLSSPELVATHAQYPATLESAQNYGFVETTSPTLFPVLTILSNHLSAAWAGQIPVDTALQQAQAETLQFLGVQ
ncbi:MAG: extracellular solute-binding protein [Deinococcus sp.]|nr:extracellular solute-binding protein [Deinococcus sp.]